MLKNMDKKDKLNIIVYTAFIIIGILFCLLKENALDIVESIVSFCVLIYGIFLLVVYSSQSKANRNKKLLTDGLVFSAIGTVLNYFPSMFVFGCGLIIALSAFGGVLEALKLKNNNQRYKLKFSLCLTSTVLGIVCMFFSNMEIAANTISLIFGLSMIIQSILNLIVHFAIDKRLEDLSKSREKAKNSIDDFKDYKIY